MSHPGFPKSCVLITHSIAIRLFIMRWFHLTVEEFEAMKSPKNAEMVVMEYDPLLGKFVLKTPVKADPDSVMRSRPIRL